MTLQDLITNTRILINQNDSENSQFTNSQISGFINEGIRYVLSKMKDIPRTEKNLTSALGDISVSENTLTIEEAYIYNSSTGKYKQLEIIDIGVLKHINSNWLNEPVGEPEYFCRKSTFVYYLYPQPSNEWVGVTIKTFGLEFPNELSNLTDEINTIPKILLDAIPHYAAYKCFSAMNMQDRANNELVYFRSAVKGLLEISTVGSSQNRRFILTEDIE